MELFSRLRATGVALLGGGAHRREIAQWLHGKGVPTVHHLTTLSQLFWSARHPNAPVIVFDHGVLDIATDLVSRLDLAAERKHAVRPIVIVVSSALAREGLADLGWKRSTHRVGFARTDGDVCAEIEGALVEVAAAEPEPPHDPEIAGTLPVGERARGDAQSEEAASFQLAELTQEIERLAWAAPLCERAGAALHVRCSLAEAGDAPPFTATVAFGFHDTDGRFSFSLHAVLAPAGAFFSAHRPRGFAGIIERLRTDPEIGELGFDDAFIVRADDRGLAEARAGRALVARAASSLESLEWNDGALVAGGDRLPRAEALAAAGALLDLWRALVRARLGFAT